jgi:hypothetical protein
LRASSRSIGEQIVGLQVFSVAYSCADTFVAGNLTESKVSLNSRNQRTTKNIMKYLTSLIFAILLAFAPGAAHATTASIGGIAGTPEYFGLATSIFPSSQVSLDAWLTLSTVDAGVTIHIPVAGETRLDLRQNMHNILLTAMGGYAHNLVDTFPKSDYHALVAGGYGYRHASGWDLRGQLGAEIYGAHPVEAQFHGHVYLGHFF